MKGESLVQYALLCGLMALITGAGMIALGQSVADVIQERASIREDSPTSLHADGTWRSGSVIYGTMPSLGSRGP